MYKALFLLALVVVALLLGCATTPEPTPKKERLLMGCAMVGTGTATFDNDPKAYPLIRLVCDRELNR